MQRRERRQGRDRSPNGILGLAPSRRDAAEVIREDEEVVEVNAVIGRVEPTWNLICVTQRESSARQILRRTRLDHLPYLVRAIHDTNLVGISHTVDHVDIDVMRLPGG